MQSARDSSVLFALDELRHIEDERKGELAAAAREQEERRLLLAEREAARQRDSERQVAELAALRKQAELDREHRAKLETRLVADGHCRSALERRLRLVECQSAEARGELLPPRSARLHALWSAALLIASASAYLLASRATTGRASSAPPMRAALRPTPAALAAVPADCPDPAPVVAVPEKALEDGAPETMRPKRRPPRPERKSDERGAQESPIEGADSCEGKGPLCGLPE